jgi:hypothetical protein
MKPGSITNRCLVILVLTLSLDFSLLTSSEATPSNLYYSMQHPIWPPMPGPWLDLDLNTYWLSNNVYAVDDTEVDYDALRAQNSSGAETDDTGGWNGYQLSSFGPDDLWIEITSMNSSNQTANLTLHGTIEGDHYQLLSKTNLIQPGEWRLGQIITGDPSTDQTDFSPHFVGTNSKMFFKAHHEILLRGSKRV